MAARRDVRCSGVLDAEVCIKLLRRARNFQGVARQISKANASWVQEFLELNGLDLLLNIIQRLSSRSHSAEYCRMNSNDCKCCLKCLRCIVRFKGSLEFFTSHGQLYTTALAKALDTTSICVKQELLSIFNALAYFDHKGYATVEAVIHQYQDIKRIPYNYSFLVNELKNATNLGYQSSIFQLINILIQKASNYMERCRIRQDLLALGLNEQLVRLRKEGNNETLIQLDVFDQSRHEDEADWSEQGNFSMNNPADLFDFIINKIKGCPPLSVKFLHVLQHLVVIDPESPLSYTRWNIIERFLESVVYFEAESASILESTFAAAKATFSPNRRKDAEMQTELPDILRQVDITSGAPSSSSASVCHVGVQTERQRRVISCIEPDLGTFPRSGSMSAKRNLGGSRLAVDRTMSPARSTLTASQRNLSGSRYLEPTLSTRGKTASTSTERISASKPKSSNKLSEFRPAVPPHSTQETRKVSPAKPGTSGPPEGSKQHAQLRTISEAKNSRKPSSSSTTSVDSTGARPTIQVSGGPFGAAVYVPLRRQPKSASSDLRRDTIHASLRHGSQEKLQRRQTGRSQVLPNKDSASSSHGNQDARKSSAENSNVTSSSSFESQGQATSSTGKRSNIAVLKQFGMNRRRPMRSVQSSFATATSGTNQDSSCGSSEIDGTPDELSDRYESPSVKMRQSSVLRSNRNVHLTRPSSCCLPIPEAMSQLRPRPSILPLLPPPPIADSPCETSPVLVSPDGIPGPASSSRQQPTSGNGSQGAVICTPTPFAPPPPPPPPNTLPLISKASISLTGSIPPPPPPPPALGSMNSASPSALRPLSIRFEDDDIDGEPSPFSRKSNTFPRHKSVLKTIPWSKFNHMAIKNREGNNLWKEQHEIDIQDDDLSKLEELFARNTIKHKDDRVAISPGVKIPDEVQLLDSKRSLNISIFLRQFRSLTINQVVDSIVQGNAGRFGTEQLKCLRKMLPDKVEIELIKSYEGDLSKLGTAEKFVLAISDHKYFPLRLDILIAKEEIDPMVAGLHESLQTIEGACNAILESDSLKRFFLIIREAGNHINEGTYAGNAAGFRLSSLTHLWETKTNKPRVTFIHAVVEIAERAKSDSIGFLDHTSLLANASRLSIEGIITESSQLSKLVSELEQSITDKDNQALVQQYGTFLEEAKLKCSDLVERIEKIAKLTARLQTYFCEESKLEEILQVLHDLVQHVATARKENVQRKLNEERLARQAKEREERALIRARKGRSSLRLDPKEDCVLDKLLEEIRQGDRKLRQVSTPTEDERRRAKRRSSIAAVDIKALQSLSEDSEVHV